MLVGNDESAPGNGRIEAKVRSNQDRRQFLALYLVLRTIIWVSSTQKILFWYTKDTFSGSLDREPVSWFRLADPYFLYLCIPWSPIKVFPMIMISSLF